MTLAAAAGTLVIVVGVLGGPAVLRCTNAPEGLLACLRGEIVDVGLLPEPRIVAEPAAKAPVSPEPTPAEPIPTAPDLTLVRAEPDGQVLIAGTATPGLAVQVFVNGELLGVTTTEPGGDWVLVPDAPLPAGTATVTVGTPDTKEPRASATVVIAPDKAAPPVVTIGDQLAPTLPTGAPPAPKLSAPEPAIPETEPAAAPPIAQSPKPPPLEPATAPAVEIAEATPPKEEPKPEATVVETPEGEASKAAEPKNETPKAEQPKAEEFEIDEPEVETASPATPPLIPSKPVAAPGPSPERPAAPSPPPKVSKPVTELAKPEPEAPPITKPAPADKNPAAQPKPAEGTQPTRPIVPVGPVLPVAPVKPASPLAPTAAADKPVPSTQPSLRVAGTPPTRTPEDTPTVVPAPPAPGPTIDAIEIDGTANFFAGAGPEGATIELFVQDRFIAKATVEGGRWLVEANGALTLPAQRVRVELADAPGGNRSARGEVNFILDLTPPPDLSGAGTGTAGLSANASGDLAVPVQPESELELDRTIPTLRATPPADPTMLRFSSGKAIIRRGETLWAIATRVYGDGSQYPRIVRANPDLIAHPERIFPGQVFDLPALQGSQAAD